MITSHIIAALIGFGLGVVLTLWINQKLNARERAGRNQSCIL